MPNIEFSGFSFLGNATSILTGSVSEGNPHEDFSAYDPSRSDEEASAGETKQKTYRFPYREQSFSAILKRFAGQILISPGDGEAIVAVCRGSARDLAELQVTLNSDELTVFGPAPRNRNCVIQHGGSRSNFSITVNSSRDVETIPMGILLLVPEISEISLSGFIQKVTCKNSVESLTFEPSFSGAARFGVVKEIAGEIASQSNVRIDNLTVPSTLRLRGQSSTKVNVAGGHNLEITTTDQASCSVSGDCAAVELTAKDSSSISVTGNVSGNVGISCSGMSSATHEGDILGSLNLSAKDSSSAVHKGIVAGSGTLVARNMATAKNEGEIRGCAEILASDMSNAKNAGRIGGDVTISASNMATARNDGEILGSLSISSSDMAKAKQSGAVTGKVTQNKRGAMATLKVS